ncbi:hypothetical protein D9M68_807840 [compost metagenome]
MKCHRGSGGLGVRLNRQHQGMGIDDSGGRRPERGDAGQRRFKFASLIGVQPLQVIDTVADALLQQLLQRPALVIISGDD